MVPVVARRKKWAEKEREREREKMLQADAAKYAKLTDLFKGAGPSTK